MKVMTINLRRPGEGQGHTSDRPNTVTLLHPMTGVLVTVECTVLDDEGDDHQS